MASNVRLMGCVPVSEPEFVLPLERGLGVHMTTVLVVDDYGHTRTSLETALSLAGFVVKASTSALATQAAADPAVDIAIVDLMLHGTNGFALARALRDTHPEVRVVLTSEYQFSVTQLERMDCGAVGFVPQPFEVDELASFLRAKMGLFDS